MDFWRLFRLVYARRWLIVLIVLVAAGVIFAGATLQAQRKTFQADAYIQPPERNPGEDPAAAANNGQKAQERIARVSDLVMILRTSNDFHRSLAELLQMPEKERVARVETILERNNYFAQVEAQIREDIARQVREGRQPSGDVKGLTNRTIREAHETIAREIATATDDGGTFAASGVRASLPALLKEIRKRLKFEPMNGPLATENDPSLVNLVQVSCTHNREAAAQLYANLACVAFMDFYSARGKTSVAAQRRDFEEKSDLANRSLQEARSALVAYQQASDIAVLSPEQSASITNVVKYEGERAALQGEVQAAAAAIGIIRNQMKGLGTTRQVEIPGSENPLVVALTSQVQKLRIDFNTVSSRYGENHPSYIAAQAALRSAERELEEAASRPYTQTKPDDTLYAYRAQLGDAQIKLQSAQARLTAVEQELARERAKVATLPEAAARYADLKREVALREENVASIERARQKFEIDTVSRDGAGRVDIAKASVTQIGGEPGTKWAMMAYGAVLALIFGIALVVAMDALDNSIRSSTDVEKLMELPIAGIIPAQLPDPHRAPKITALEPLSPVAESYRLLRTDLLFTAAEHPFQSLMVATGKPGQGATTTVCNLAIAMAQAGKRVILVDADLRMPKLHHVFRVSNDVGLTSVLLGMADFEEALQATEIDNLLVLPAGPPTQNPSELLGSVKMRALHDRLKGLTDFILFDTPSAIAFSDGVVLSSFLDSVLMVIRANNIPRGSEHHVKQMFAKAKANIIGVVLNGMNPEMVDSVHYHYHYYSSTSSRGYLPEPDDPDYDGGYHRQLPPGEREPVAAATGAASPGAEASPGAFGFGESSGAAPLPVHVAERTAAAYENYYQPPRRNVWKQVRAVAVYVVVAVIVAGLVLALNGSVSP